MMLRGGTSSIFTGVSRSQGEVCGFCGFAGSCVWRVSVFGVRGGQRGCGTRRRRCGWLLFFTVYSAVFVYHGLPRSFLNSFVDPNTVLFAHTLSTICPHTFARPFPALPRTPSFLHTHTHTHTYRQCEELSIDVRGDITRRGGSPIRAGGEVDIHYGCILPSVSCAGVWHRPLFPRRQGG